VTSISDGATWRSWCNAPLVQLWTTVALLSKRVGSGTADAIRVGNQESQLCRSEFFAQMMGNPHLFRDCVATPIALEDPEHVHIAADLLGHTTLEFTQRHYIQAQTRVACSTYQGTLEDLHRSLQRKHPNDSSLNPGPVKRYRGGSTAK
jgi:hypothetical protein